MPFLLPFLAVAALGLVAVASLVPTLLPVVAQLRALPGLEGQSDAAIVGLSLIQPAVLTTLGALIGTALAHRVGLRSAIVEACRGRPGSSDLPRTLPLAVGMGFGTGLAIVLLDLAFSRAMGGWTTVDAGADVLPVARISALLYGGVAEEIMLRFGLMTLLVWAGARLLRGAFAARPGAIVGAAIVLAALVFAVGHLPKLFAVTEPGTALVLRTIALNTLAGLVYGWLYWRHTLEHAMLAHMATHGAFWLAGAALARLAA